VRNETSETLPRSKRRVPCIWSATYREALCALAPLCNRVGAGDQMIKVLHENIRVHRLCYKHCRWWKIPIIRKSLAGNHQNSKIRPALRDKACKFEAIE
jgi:hypothetical protein